MDYQRALSTNSTASFATIISKVADPWLTDGCIKLKHRVDKMAVQVYGVGNDDGTCGCKVYGWRAVRRSGGVTLWIPTQLVHLAATLSTSVGVADAALLATERFADTVAATSGALNTVLPTVTANTPMTAIVTVSGFDVIQFDFDKGTVTSVNALYCVY